MPLDTSFLERSTSVGIAHDKNALTRLVALGFGTETKLNTPVCSYTDEPKYQPVTCLVFYSNGLMTGATELKEIMDPRDIALQLVGRFESGAVWRVGIPAPRPEGYTKAWEIRTVVVDEMPAVIARAIYAPK